MILFEKEYLGRKSNSWGFKGVSAFLSIFLVFASFAFADNERERE